MTRLDQLAKPHRRNGEHICAILERERRQALELENISKMSLSHGSQSPNHNKRKSRSMSQLSGRNIKSSRDSSRNSQNRLVSASSLHRNAKNAEMTKSMTQLSGNSDKKASPILSSMSKSGWTMLLIEKLL